MGLLECPWRRRKKREQEEAGSRRRAESVRSAVFFIVLAVNSVKTRAHSSQKSFPEYQNEPKLSQFDDHWTNFDIQSSENNDHSHELMTTINILHDHNHYISWPKIHDFMTTKKKLKKMRSNWASECCSWPPTWFHDQGSEFVQYIKFDDAGHEMI